MNSKLTLSILFISLLLSAFTVALAFQKSDYLFLLSVGANSVLTAFAGILIFSRYNQGERYWIELIRGPFIVSSLFIASTYFYLLT